MLASLYNVPGTEPEIQGFSFANMDHHRQIAGALNARGVAIQLYPLDPISTFDIESWAEIHQRAHVAFTEALGIAGVDLSEVDFKDRDQLEIWVRLHADEHRQAEDILGLGR